MSFADGHVAMHRWQGPAAIREVRYLIASGVAVVNDPDLAWLAQRTPRKN